MSGVFTPNAYGQDVGADVCIEALNKELGYTHRIFRTILFGSKKAEEYSVGTVVYEEDGSAWYKISDTEWRSADEGFESTTHFNNLIDERSEVTKFFGVPDRKGIFETKRSTTSELIPWIGTSLRTFQCHLHQFCDAVNKSKKQSGDLPVSITAVYPGCVDTNRLSIPQCHINQRGTNVDKAIIYTNCEEAVEQLLEQEAETLKLIVQYDAAYRTLQQLAGNMDLFLQELNWPMTHTLQQAVDLVGVLGRIPCYLSSCEAFPPPN